MPVSFSMFVPLWIAMALLVYFTCLQAQKMDKGVLGFALTLIMALGVMGMIAYAVRITCAIYFPQASFLWNAMMMSAVFGKIMHQRFDSKQVKLPKSDHAA